ncbi:hypothetical protein [Sphingobacterium mizutaii]|uniref:hypothetical protein n=1 Tax=Sphingobacterium mizutaii TaxID=1010 RepID=UPI001629342A|nr:hypothetical protein [Sphingobacterium mizutaii]
METGKFYFFSNGEAYLLRHSLDLKYKDLRLLYKSLDEKSDKFLYYTFFTLTSSIIELSLNYISMFQCINIYGFKDYKNINEIYTNLSFAKKIQYFPIIFSSGEYTTNNDSSTIKIILKFISDRNKLMHPKPLISEGKSNFPLSSFNNFEELFTMINNEGESDLSFQFKTDDLKYFEISFEDCKSLAQALGDFKKNYFDLMILEKISSSNLIKSIS